MTRSEALELVRKHVAGMEANAEAELVVNDDMTEEHPAGFVFFYNTKSYWQTRNIMDGLAGNGPLLVRNDGTIQVLPTNQSVGDSLAAA